MITFGQFLLVAMEGLGHQITWGKNGIGLKKTAIPLSHWLLLVTLFFVVSLLNMTALSYNISMPLHIIFRSGGLIVNMLIGMAVLGKRYSLGQMSGVVLVTIGVVWATLDHALGRTEGSSETTYEFSIGILLLIIVILLSAAMGLFQEAIYEKYGKHWREGLFYTHFLALPFFLFYSSRLTSQVHEYNQSPLMPILDILWQIPVIGSVAHWIPNVLKTVLQTVKMRKLWAYFVLNVFTQYLCISGVNRMTSVATSLTLALILNLRKFVSLIISIVYFENEFGFGAKAGTLFVFLGTLVYTHAGIYSGQKPLAQKITQLKN
ncbi:UAA transporter [Sporodiniella umbellata]|nr:UAA transporter [Sporodiniella umbellata]